MGDTAAYIITGVGGKSSEYFSRGIGVVGDLTPDLFMGVNGKGSEYFSRGVGICYNTYTCS